MASSGDASTCQPHRWPPHPAVASVLATITAAREGIWSTVLRHRTTAGCTVSSKPEFPPHPSASPTLRLSLRVFLYVCVAPHRLELHSASKERKNSLSVFNSPLSLLKLLTRLEEQTRNCNCNWIFIALI